MGILGGWAFPYGRGASLVSCPVSSPALSRASCLVAQPRLPPRPTARASLPVRSPGRMPVACVHHAFVPVFPCHVRPLKGGHVTKHRSSPLYRSSPPSYLPGVSQKGGTPVQRQRISIRSMPYRSTSLIRNCPPPSTTIEPFPSGAMTFSEFQGPG